MTDAKTSAPTTREHAPYRSVIQRRVHKKISALSEKNCAVVLKGIESSFIGDENFPVDFDAAKDNPLNYFTRLINDGRKFFTHEEFLLMNAFVLNQFDTVRVLNNNVFIEQYPIAATFCAATRKILLEHFTELEDDFADLDAPENFGTVAKLIDLFIGLKDCGNFLVGVYNDEHILSDPKVTVVNLFAAADVELAEVDSSAAQNFFDLREETDFVDFARTIIFDAPEKIFVRTNNYTGDGEKLDARLKILHANFSAQTEIFRVRPEEFQRDFEHRDAYTEILKRHWGYDAFRKFRVYDLQKLDDGIKSTFAVSQEQIISDIVRQVELCMAGENFRDVFVTAPTGAGKSVIFQIPAIYFAERDKLLTLVISPLIGLMNDQVKNLTLKNYLRAETINSDLSPILKEQILGKVAAGECNILYLSPETLLARSDIEQLIGDRTIGMVIIDEAHIVTTWGKQFRPDYWYLGDHIRKLRRVQLKRKGHEFVIATFTATAIYRGPEDMYDDTINSLHLRDPITYLGYVKRGDIDITIDKAAFEAGERAEFELPKYRDLRNAVIRANINAQKTLIYFPEVQLIERARLRLQNDGDFDGVAIYHGQLSRDDKRESYEKFLHGDALVMLATKAFGMGIDIDDIEIVMHFAPTGNICDYVQEIGRAARRKNLRGEALYHYDHRDFRYINRLHGLSAVKPYQLVAVVKKIYELWNFKRRSNFLIDAENFSYIFDRYGDEANSVNKVKTALLIIQKDFEARLGFSPLTVRPIPLFADGFFVINPATQKNLRRDFGNCLTEIERELHICRVNLQTIWERDFRKHSFPQFKYLLYTKSPELNFNARYPLEPALRVEINFAQDFRAVFKNLFGKFKAAVQRSTAAGSYVSAAQLSRSLVGGKISTYRAENISDILIASIVAYRKNFSRGMHAVFAEKPFRDGLIHYRFNEAIKFYFAWVEKIFSRIVDETHGDLLYIPNAAGDTAKAFGTVLGILEALGVLNFKMTGGANSQLYVHINQIRNLKNIIDAGARYRNKILESVAARHKISVAMLTYLYEGDFDGATIWDLLEDYFLGKIPDAVTEAVAH